MKKKTLVGLMAVVLVATAGARAVNDGGEARGIDTRKVTGVVFDAASPAQEYASVTWYSSTTPGRRLLGFTTSPDTCGCTIHL